MDGRISYWLIPAEPHRSEFRKAIFDLAQRFDGPVFEPHVTLYSGSGGTNEVENILARATAGFSEIGLRSAGIGHSSQFTQTLFLKFDPCEALFRLSNDLKRSSTRADDYTLLPHLSLLYARVEPAVRMRLVDQFKFPPLMRFDEVQAVNTGARNESREDVERWRLVGSTQLRSAR